MRKIRHCPCCAYSFKNFKWRKTWKYDGDIACCPNCNLPALEWRNYKPERLTPSKLKDKYGITPEESNMI